MWHIRFNAFVVGVFLLVALGACGGDDKPKDTPRYTPEQAQSLMESEAYHLVLFGLGVRNEPRRLSCGTPAEYRGGGLWECDIIGLDERTGKVWRR